MDLQNYGPGRPTSPDMVQVMHKMIKLIGKEPGIPSARLAKILGLSSIRCSTLARRLQKKDLIKIDKQDRMLTYSLIS